MTRKRIILILKAFLTFGLFYFSSIFAYLGAFIFRIDLTTMSATESIFLSTFADIILAIILFLLYFKELKQEFKIYKDKFAYNFDVGLKYWFFGVLIMVCSNVLIAILTPLNNSTNETAVQAMIQVSPWLMLLTAGIIAPFVEEITFRKAFRNLFKNKWVFAISSGLVFGLLHVISSFSSPFEFLYIIPYGILGFYFALSYDKTNTVFTSIVMHMIHNTVLILLSIL